MATHDLNIPALDTGIHLLDFRRNGAGETVRVIASPQRAPSVRDISQRDRVWGINLALYGVQSERNLGIGDYADLKTLTTILGGEDGDFLGLNPLHAIGSSPQNFSPYSPSHRAFLNCNHIALDHIPGLESSQKMREVISKNQDRIRELRADRFIDYHKVRCTFHSIAFQLYDVFQAQTDARILADFKSFKHKRGSILREFARLEAARFTKTKTLPQFAQSTEAIAEYLMWLQWVADCQLTAAQSAAKSAGMSLGLFLDLAVGTDRKGAEAAAKNNCLARGVSIGAPPDRFNPTGQNWNLAPFDPLKLGNQDYAPYRRILAAAMRYAGVLRIDHILGLMRSFWLPDNGAPGAYVRQPLEPLLAITKIEAQNSGTVVIGEDLGLIPKGFRTQLRDHGFYGYSVLQFEESLEEGLRQKDVLACFSTHDTPTIRGFQTGRDLDWSQRLGLISAAQTKQLRAKREAVVKKIKDTKSAAVFCDTIHHRMMRSSAAFVCAQLDDILLQEDAQNLPGTVDEHPNWRRKYRIPLDRIRTHQRFREFCAIARTSVPVFKYPQRKSANLR
ncbi:MAG: 4-alpha-glucanotransferase [Aestuariivita sp.]|nr:4-alpha-glucanotransferase [Aestuariivita sp.]MCY4201454.1 4-alpha-glucanotransferase [Aestuariivita sp.]